MLSSENREQSKKVQQQKLHRLISQGTRTLGAIPIYNSRNYIDLLARKETDTKDTESTIVEITSTYQPHTQFSWTRKSTIVEITSTYQPVCNLADILQIYNSRNYIDLLATGISTYGIPIYNSRNYIDLLAPRPSRQCSSNLQQQKLHRLISLDLGYN